MRKPTTTLPALEKELRQFLKDMKKELKKQAAETVLFRGKRMTKRTAKILQLPNIDKDRSGVLKFTCKPYPKYKAVSAQVNRAKWKKNWTKKFKRMMDAGMISKADFAILNQMRHLSPALQPKAFETIPESADEYSYVEVSLRIR